MFNPSEISVAILAGGLGTRIQQVIKNRPKALVEIKDKQFLEYLLDQLSFQGFKNIVICTGFFGDQIKNKFGKNYKGLNLFYSHEETALGTAGALRLALPLLESEQVLILNGDSYIDINFSKFLKFYEDKKAKVAIALTFVKDTNRYGKVIISDDNSILGFEEKGEEGKEGVINAGVYLLNHSIIEEIPVNKAVSLEKEVFPYLVDKDFYGYISQGNFLDIGTPESLAKAEHFFNQSIGVVKRFILLDRDGTIIQERNYLSNPEDVELIPGAANGLKELKRLGFGLLVITNQSGISRGYFSKSTLKKINQRMIKLLKEEGVTLDDIYICPHLPEDNCLCRKPKTKLVKQAQQKYHFDPKKSSVIGDHKSDIDLGKNIGAVTFLVKTGHGMGELSKKKIDAGYIVENLFEAAQVIKRLIKEG